MDTVCLTEVVGGHNFQLRGSGDLGEGQANSQTRQKSLSLSKKYFFFPFFCSASGEGICYFFSFPISLSSMSVMSSNIRKQASPTLFLFVL